MGLTEEHSPSESCNRGIEERTLYAELLRVWSRPGAVLALSAFLLFAHGCHADEDHELFKVTRVGVAP